MDKAAVFEALNAVIDPLSGKGLSEAGLVRGLVLGERAGFMLEVPAEAVDRYESAREQAQAILAALPGVQKAQVVLTAEAPPVSAAPKAAKLSPAAAEQGRPKAPVASERPAHVRRVIAVGSGKGGVGKSTVALNLTLGLAALGLRVGMLDADIYGPSVPVMTGLTRPPEFGGDKLMVPPKAFGVKFNSVGFLVDESQALIWRGPMASQALNQLLTQTRWGTVEEPLDVLVVDLPPGTGDVQLTLTQKTLIDGAVVVSTPQDMALADAKRAVTLFEKTGIPVLGIVENMSWYETPDGTRVDIFGHGGAREMAETLDVGFLGEVPLDPALRAATDTATPMGGAMAERFKDIAEAVQRQLF